MAGGRRLATALFGAAAGLVLAAAPWGIGDGRFSTRADAGEAASGNSGKGSPGGGNSASGGRGAAGAGQGGSGKGNSGKGSSGSPGAGKAEGWRLGPEAGAQDRVSQSGRGFTLKAKAYVSPTTGSMIVVSGSDVEVLHSDGFREGIVDGRYSMNDSQGRLIIERAATETDRVRLRALLRQ